MKAARNFAILAVVALVIFLLPGGGRALNVLLTLLSIAFFAFVAMLGYRLYREHRFTLESLGDRLRLVLYGSMGLAVVTFAATARLFHSGLIGLLAWVALLGLCSYGIFWVYSRYRRYE